MRARWTALRNRLLASPGFRRMALAFPPTRPVARAHAGALFDLVAGFVYSQVTLAFVESGLLDALSRRRLLTGEAATESGLSRSAVARLLRAAAALELAEKLDGDSWTLGGRGAALAGTEGLVAMIRHHRLLYDDLADPIGLLSARTTASLPRFWDYREGDDPAAVTAYSALMAATQPMIASEAIHAYPFRRHRRLLDVGGGEGAFLAAVGEAAPELQLGLLDLPAVVERACKRIAAAGLTERTTFHPGSFLVDPVPEGYDAISLVRVLHDHDDDVARRILAAVARALPRGGRVVVAEPMADAPDNPAAGDAYFGFYLLAMGSGRPRTPREIMVMLGDAGFGEARLQRTRTRFICQVISARA